MSKHGRERHTRSALYKHQKGSKCRLRLIDRIILQLDVDQIISELNNPSPSLQSHSSGRPLHCPGVSFPWDLVSPYLSYPFATRDPSSPSSPAYEIISVNPPDSIIHVRSHECSGTYSRSSTTCTACQAESKVEKRSQSACMHMSLK